MSYSLSMLVPAYNEQVLLEPFIRKSMSDLAKVATDFEIVLVNDASVDNTLKIAQKLATEYNNLRVINMEKNQGTGKVFRPAFAAASKEIVFWNTVDAFFNTEDLPQLLPFLDSYDVVSCYRSDLKANNLYKKILTLGNYYLIRLLFGLRLKAYQTVQFHRNSFLKSIVIEGTSSFLAPELLLKAHRSGKSIKEVKVTFHPRLAGKAKGGNFKTISLTFKDISRLWFKWVILRQMKLSGKA
jgi:glycosyltransferase involved in cell wall biosynthesis